MEVRVNRNHVNGGESVGLKNDISRFLFEQNQQILLKSKKEVEFEQFLNYASFNRKEGKFQKGICSILYLIFVYIQIIRSDGTGFVQVAQIMRKIQIGFEQQGDF